jgi:WD40-like Beta Propeller Repeat
VAAFSPDERWLAAGVSVRGHKRVAVVDVRAGRWTLVPDSRLAGYEVMAWSPSGRWLYFTAGGRRLFGWRLGAQDAVPLPVRAGGTIMSIATASS